MLREVLLKSLPFCLTLSKELLPPPPARCGAFHKCAPNHPGKCLHPSPAPNRLCPKKHGTSLKETEINSQRIILKNFHSVRHVFRVAGAREMAGGVSRPALTTTLIFFSYTVSTNISTNISTTINQHQIRYHHSKFPCRKTTIVCRDKQI